MPTLELSTEKPPVPAIRFGSKSGEAWLTWEGFDLKFETRETAAGVLVRSFYHPQRDIWGFVEAELSPSTEDLSAEFPDVVMADIPRYTHAQWQRVLPAVANRSQHEDVWAAFNLAADIWPNSIDTVMYLRHQAGIKLHPIEVVMCPNMTLQTDIIAGYGGSLLDWSYARVIDQDKGHGATLFEVDVTKIPGTALQDVPEYIRAFADTQRQEEGRRAPEPIRMVGVVCPTTHNQYLLRVPPPTEGGTDDATEMVAWTFGVSREEYVLDDEG